MTNNLKPGERLDDLQIKGYEIIQSPGRFCFGMDAVLLSAFAKVKAGECVLDLGTGTEFSRFFWPQRQKESILQGWRSRKRAQIWRAGASGTTSLRSRSTL